MSNLNDLHANEQGTRQIAGKHYHWVKVDGRLSLRPGFDPETQARVDAATPKRRTAL